MKINILKISLLVLLFNSCASSKKEDEITLIPKEVSIIELKQALPPEIYTKKVVYFKDKKGEDVKIELVYTESKNKVLHENNVEYTREYGRVKYTNAEKKIATIVYIDSQLSYTQPPAPFSYLSVSNIINDHANNLLNDIILDYKPTTKKIVATGDFAKMIETETILGKTFKNVFHSTYEKDFYKNQLGFNMTYGVVSLNDFDGNLYVFDRFE